MKTLRVDESACTIPECLDICKTCLRNTTDTKTPERQTWSNFYPKRNNGVKPPTECDGFLEK